ncbi:MAG: hypothetical protein J4O07_08855 [Chloroflexi bacterium]|nr:hypothetical protein [Chloroflexota bacterium]
MPTAKMARHPQKKSLWHLAAPVSTCASPNGYLRRTGSHLDAAGRYLILVHAIIGLDASRSPSITWESQRA